MLKVWTRDAVEMRYLAGLIFVAMHVKIEDERNRPRR